MFIFVPRWSVVAKNRQGRAMSVALEVFILRANRIIKQESAIFKK